MEGGSCRHQVQLILDRRRYWQYLCHESQIILAMPFGESIHIEHLHALAPEHLVRAEVSKLLAILGASEVELLPELSLASVIQKEYVRLQSSTSIAVKASRCKGDMATAASQFWAAQAIVQLVAPCASPTGETRFLPGIAKLLHTGADALFQVGEAQFRQLVDVAKSVTTWLQIRDVSSLAIIESPLGNSLPVQFLCEVTRFKDIAIEVIQWNSPRNDRRARGRTVSDSARDVVEAASGSDFILYIDDAITGTRFLKLHDALAGEVNARKLLSIAMVFDDLARPSLTTNNNRKRLRSRLLEHQEHVGYTASYVEFPSQVPFHVDEEGPVCWQSPVIWGESDLIAGKRKVNLVFTLIDHFWAILEDLGRPESKYLHHLETCWSKDTSGKSYLFEPGITTSVFATINYTLSVHDMCGTMHDLARERFPMDYVGDVPEMSDDLVDIRYEWIRDTFKVQANGYLVERRVNVAWNAIVAVFTATSHIIPLAASRDRSYASYTLPFSSTMSQLNVRLLERLKSEYTSLT